MEEIYELRRLVLKESVDALGRGGIASIAKALEVEPNYISRCLYPPGKPGRKNIGDELVIRAMERLPELGMKLDDINKTLRTGSAAAKETEIQPEAAEAASIISSLDSKDRAEILHWLRVEAIRRRHAGRDE